MSELLNLVLNTLDDKQAEDIVTIDVHEVNPFTDYYAVCTAKNVRHAQSLAEFVSKEAEKNGYSIRVREGERDSTWVLLDMNEVVVHIFTAETRKLYRLETLWGDCPQESYPAK